MTKCYLSAAQQFQAFCRWFYLGGGGGGGEQGGWSWNGGGPQFGGWPIKRKGGFTQGMPKALVNVLAVETCRSVPVCVGHLGGPGTAGPTAPEKHWRYQIRPVAHLFHVAV